MNRNDLPKDLQLMYDEIQDVFLRRKDISQKGFVKVLGVLINKYKR